MVKNKIPESIKELLKNSSFVLWCLAPTEESDITWRKWVEMHPDKTDDFIKAKQIILSTKLNKYTLRSEESKLLYSRLSTSLNKRKKQKLLRIILTSAASLALLCMIGIWGFYQSKTVLSEELLTNTEIKIDSTQTEVELELSESKKMLIDNKAIIQLSEKGNIQITNAQNKTIPVSHIENKEEKQIVATKMNVLKVPNGRHSSVVLADGTKVWVNSGTILSFPSTFENDNRTISVNGEIYLEVAKDAIRPFHVKTSEMDVCVLGTAFNVMAYNTDRMQSVVLAKGSVEVKSKNGNVRKIQPAEMIVLEGDRMNIAYVDVYDYISWKDGVLQFDRKKMGDVILRLSRYYGMEFECSEVIQNYICSGKLVLFDDITSVLVTLKESFPISYHIEGNKVKLSSNLIK